MKEFLLSQRSKTWELYAFSFVAGAAIMALLGNILYDLPTLDPVLTTAMAAIFTQASLNVLRYKLEDRAKPKVPPVWDLFIMGLTSLVIAITYLPNPQLGSLFILIFLLLIGCVTFVAVARGHI